MDEVDPYKVVMTKTFSDGVLFQVTRICFVKFNLLERDGNVRMMVSEIENMGGQAVRQRSIDHLIPLIREIRSKIDGTPTQDIANDAVNQLPSSGNERKKSLGLGLGNKNSDGYAVITFVEDGSKAAEAGMVAQDVLLEVNGRSTKDMDLAALKAYLANKSAKESSLILVYSRNGAQSVVMVK